MESTAPPKPRWRPRFSLRTLMIGVLLIAFSWTATQIYGIPEIKNAAHMNRKYQIYTEVYQDSTTNGRAVAPFVIGITHTTPEGIIFLDETWIWMFGYTFRLRVREPLLNNFVPAEAQK